jgi:Kef-type K+ transport system membrane component KefB
VFSRDPGKVRIDASFSSVYELFCPFFFIGIGLQMAPDSLGGATGMGLAFLGAAVLGKIIGTIGPALFCAGVAQAVILAVSMVPRAEITLVIMNKGLQLGKDVVSRQVFSAMVMVSAATCAVAPVILQKLLRKTGSSETET